MLAPRIGRIFRLLAMSHPYFTIAISPCNIYACFKSTNTEVFQYRGIVCSRQKPLYELRVGATSVSVNKMKKKSILISWTFLFSPPLYPPSNGFASFVSSIWGIRRCILSRDAFADYDGCLIPPLSYRVRVLFPQNFFNTFADYDRHYSLNCYLDCYNFFLLVV